MGGFLPGGVPLPHAVAIEAYEGTNGNGEKIYAAAVTVDAFVEQKLRFVRSPTTGDAVASSTVVITYVDTVAPPESRVTCSTGHFGTVVDAMRRDGGGLPTPDHLELRLT